MSIKLKHHFHSPKSERIWHLPVGRKSPKAKTSAKTTTAIPTPICYITMHHLENSNINVLKEKGFTIL